MKNTKKRVIKKKSDINEVHIVLAAVGVMQDEINGPIPTDELSFCLRVDFKHKIKEHNLLSILNQAVNSHFIENTPQGWQLTVEGGQIADDTLEILNKL